MNKKKCKERNERNFQIETTKLIQHISETIQFFLAI